jgi:hypothetical protein
MLLGEGKEDAMRKLSLIVASLTMLVLLSTGPAYSQVGPIVIRGDIPFDFTVVDKTLPAGNYDVKNVMGSAVEFLHIRGTENQEQAGFLAIAVEKTGKLGKPMFVFRRYGDKYFLAVIWAGVGTERELPKSYQERQISQFQPKPELIMIAAK